MLNKVCFICYSFVIWTFNYSLFFKNAAAASWRLSGDNEVYQKVSGGVDVVDVVASGVASLLLLAVLTSLMLLLVMLTLLLLLVMLTLLLLLVMLTLLLLLVVLTSLMLLLVVLTSLMLLLLLVVMSRWCWHRWCCCYC